MHNLITGFYVPNQADNQAGHDASFGSTIVIADKQACGGGNVKPAATERGEMFVELMSDLGL